MTTNGLGVQAPQPPPGRFWIVRRIWPYIAAAILGILPCPDLASRRRIRRDSVRLVTLRTWPGREASSAEAAQLAMLRILWLQRQTRRAVRGRHSDAAAMLARASVEALLLGLYCLRVPEAIAKLQADNLKSLVDGFTYLGELDFVPARVIQDCVVKIGQPSRKYLSVWEMVQAIDGANGNEAARSIYRRLYIPLSNFTVHANGGTLLRHVRSSGKIRRRPSRSCARRTPVRVADAVSGLMAAAIAQRAGVPHEKLLAYADRHSKRALLPMVVMAFSGMNGPPRPHRIREVMMLVKDTYTYLWTGPAGADSIEARAAFVRERFARMLDLKDSGLPEDALDPFIEYVADQLAHAVPAEQPNQS